MPNELTVIESRDLEQYESVITHGMQTFVEVGTALLQIRDQRLYRATHKRFEDYCQERWGWSRIHVHRQIAAAQVAGNLLPIGNTPLPTAESQTRPLAQLPEDEQAEAWQRAVETAPNGRVTASHVQDVVDEMLAMSDGEPDAPAWTDSELERKALVEAGHTVTANIKHDGQLIAWAQENGIYVRIDRQTAWGNPFVLDEDGDRDDVCDAYLVYLQYKPSLQSRFDSLRGKVLGCWCHPERCHGDTLINQISGETPPEEYERVGCHR